MTPESTVQTIGQPRLICDKNFLSRSAAAGTSSTDTAVQLCVLSGHLALDHSVDSRGGSTLPSAGLWLTTLKLLHAVCTCPVQVVQDCFHAAGH